MTIMLDDQARLATGAIHDSVAAYEPAAPMPVLVRRAAVRQGVQWTMGAIAAAAFVAMVAFVFAPSPHTDVTDTTTPVTVTSLPPTTIPATTVPDEPVLRVDPPPVPAASPSTTTTSTILAPDTTPPVLEITSPAPDSHFETQIVTFSGITEPGATVVAGGKFAADVGGEGRWTIDLVIFAGKNGAKFVATDEAGNETSASIAVWLDVAEEAPPPKEEEPPPPPTVEFSAFATYGSCSLDPPYDIYYGTAEPGSKVTITSEYGSGSVTAGADGKWEKKVVFASAPYEETFVVTVKDATGAKQHFEFIAYAP